MTPGNKVEIVSNALFVLRVESYNEQSKIMTRPASRYFRFAELSTIPGTMHPHALNERDATRDCSNLPIYFFGTYRIRALLRVIARPKFETIYYITMEFPR